MTVSPGSPLFDSITARLRAAGCVFAEEEAALIINAAQTADDIDHLVERRVAGTPLEYILGWAEFWGGRVIVEPGVFVPRRRTEALAREASGLIGAGPVKDRLVVLDLCCGSGAVAIALCERHPDIAVFAADIGEAAVHCARRNLGVRGSVFHGDLFDALPEDLHGGIDIIVANAPYVPTADMATMPPEARLYEGAIALDGGTDGLDFHRRVAADVTKWLTRGGFLLVETSRAQADSTVSILRTVGLSTRILMDDELDSTVAIGQLL